MSTLRTQETKAIYDAYIAQGGLEDACVLCTSDVLKSFTYWKIIANRFPYDRIAKVHDMILPLRHVTENDLTEAERDELHSIKTAYLNEHYDVFLEASSRLKTVPAHFHLHLIVLKD